MAARKLGAAELVDPRPYLVGELKQTFAAYPGIGPILPAIGYGEQQRRDLAATIAAVPCDTVVVATPIDLRRVIDIRQRAVRVYYDLQEIGQPTMADVLKDFFAGPAAARRRLAERSMTPGDGMQATLLMIKPDAVERGSDRRDPGAGRSSRAEGEAVEAGGARAGRGAAFLSGA